MSIARLSSLLVLCASLLGCAGHPARVAPGASAADARALAGAPTAERTLPDGIKAWYYESGPGGFTTYRVRLDASDRVLDSEQVLTEKNFRSNLVVNKTSREQVLEQLGKPALVSRFPNLSEEVWTYRYMDGTLEMLNDIHIDAASGVVKSYSLYRDPAYSVILG